LFKACRERLSSPAATPRDFYCSLPHGMRVKILEWAIRTFLKQQR